MIELKNISKVYPGPKGDLVALNDINLSVQPGEIFGVIGKSGAGKSTLVRCVNLLERPTEGAVIVDGQDLTRLSANGLRQTRHHIGMVFQHFNLLNTRTVYQNIAFPLELIGMRRGEIKKRIEPLIEFTGLSHREHAYPSQLSGGQKQRVAIARALAMQPKVLLCDEMTSALDPETTASILSLIKDINKKMNLTILLITHEMHVIKSICDKVAVLDRGDVIEQGPVLEIFKRPKTDVTKQLTHAAIQLELPQVLRDHVVPMPTNDCFTLLRIAFVGEAVAEPIVNNLIKEYHLQVNILQANLEVLQNETVGVMLVAISSPQEEVLKGLNYLIEIGLSVEVAGYVGRDDWRIN